ncbi:hypothetical protein ACFFJI_03905 [Allobacillus sp. GCM10007491]|nr:hypothetical protein [Allobacillus saliphilus]
MITKPIPEHTEAICEICSVGWRQTVQGIYDEEYQAKNVASVKSFMWQASRSSILFCFRSSRSDTK